MQGFELSIQERSATGKGEVGRCRKQGFVPATVYSAGDKSVTAMVASKEFILLAGRASKTQLFSLKSENSSLNGKLALVKEIQRHPLRGTVLHVDFQSLREDKEITLKVPLHMIGEAPGVKTDGGVLSVAHHEVEVRCLPKNIPQRVDLDISSLGLHQSIKASEVKLPPNVILVMDPEEAIASVVVVRQVVEEAPAAATPADGAAPAEGAPAEGAAPAADAAKSDSADKGAAKK